MSLLILSTLAKMLTDLWRVAFLEGFY